MASQAAEEGFQTRPTEVAALLRRMQPDPTDPIAPRPRAAFSLACSPPLRLASFQRLHSSQRAAAPSHPPQRSGRPHSATRRAGAVEADNECVRASVCLCLCLCDCARAWARLDDQRLGRGGPPSQHDLDPVARAGARHRLLRLDDDGPRRRPRRVQPGQRHGRHAKRRRDLRRTMKRYVTIRPLGHGHSDASPREASP